mmetsp:Transcript_20577/g.32507  ORF Transcript_20577/g.32507 Transcript_20577/m.32507 type:complete len:309 (+) Transcript_20577:80-1006(+)
MNTSKLMTRVFSCSQQRATLGRPNRTFFRGLSNIVTTDKSKEIRVEEWENKDFIHNYQWLLKAVGYYNKSSVQARGACALFRAAKFGGLRKAFYTRGGVVDDFRSQQVLMTAHVWAVHKRLVKEGSDGRTVQEVLFDELWNDTMGRIRSYEFPELTINKHLRSVQEYCFGALISFDHAASFPTEEERLQEMKAAVRAHVYNHSDRASEAQCASVASYLLGEMRDLQEMDWEAVMHGRFRWAPVPFSAGKKGGKEAAAAAGEEKGDDPDEVEVLGQAGPWHREVAIDGAEYFWNAQTYESTYDKPVGMP